nr:hypothetical protein [Tanacetum cinerariifolium]
MTTLAEYIIVAEAENRPPMLEKSMYNSWLSHIRLFIKGKKHGRMMLDSINNGPLVYPTVEENGQTRPKKYSKLTEAQQLQDDCDVQATNIILHGLSPDVYALVNHQEAAKDIWDRVKMLMKGTELSYQERECRLYNLFDKFAYVQGETLKFVTDMKLAKSLYTTNYDQLYAYLSQHERHANEVRITRERYPNPLAFVDNSPTLYNLSQSPQHLGKGHMARQCTHPKRLRNATWFKEKLMLAEDQEAGQILDEVQLAFLADPGISEALVAQQAISQNSAFQIDDLDAYDSDYDDDVQGMQYSKQTHVDDCQDNKIHSGSNIISYSQYQESQDAVIQDTNPSAPNDLLVLSLVEQMTDHVAHLDKENQTNKMSGLVVVVFSVDGVTIMDELVGGGE